MVIAIAKCVLEANILRRSDFLQRWLGFPTKLATPIP